MKTKFLPLIALVSAAAFAPTAQAADTSAFVVDSAGDIVKDSWGDCVRSINWTPEADVICHPPVPEPVKAPEPKPEPVAKPVPEIKPFPAPVAEPAPVNEPTSFQGFFDFDSTELKADAKTQLDAYAEYMGAVSDVTLDIMGHTDSVGSKAYNQALSVRRADAVKAYLEGKGVAADRMTANGQGEMSPKASNKTAEGRAENRRVDITIVK